MYGYVFFYGEEVVPDEVSDFLGEAEESLWHGVAGVGVELVVFTC